jgi:energy-coupling factor transporter ATP-binding protein EcfA2
MWADVDTKRDFLNYSEVAELTVDLIKDEGMLPLSVGIFGAWGTGKSTLLNLIEGQLGADSGEKDGYIIVRFDAWLYQGFDDARAALMEVIASQLPPLTRSFCATTPRTAGPAKSSWSCPSLGPLRGPGSSRIFRRPSIS